MDVARTHCANALRERTARTHCANALGAIVLMATGQSRIVMSPSA